VISAVPSSLGHLRSVTKDALGTHVQTEQYTMHIEEVCGSDWRCIAAGVCCA
jgi:hypothetical protein